jgi:hypothetical protein
MGQQGRIWNNAPFGWDALDRRLVANPVEQHSLTRIRDLRAAGVSYHKVVATLDAEERPTKRGGSWQAASVRSVLRTEAQMGMGDEVRALGLASTTPCVTNGRGATWSGAAATRSLGSSEDR